MIGLFEICYNTSTFETLIRRLDEDDRIRMDNAIKNFFIGIMKRRRAGYEARQIPVHGKIGRDDKAGNGTHVWTY